MTSTSTVTTTTTTTTTAPEGKKGILHEGGSGLAMCARKQQGGRSFSAAAS